MVISGNGSLDGAHAIDTKNIMQVQNIRKLWRKTLSALHLPSPLWMLGGRLPGENCGEPS